MGAHGLAGPTGPTCDMMLNRAEIALTMVPLLRTIHHQQHTDNATAPQHIQLSDNVARLLYANEQGPGHAAISRQKNGHGSGFTAAGNGEDILLHDDISEFD
jgi:hypothetical protein